jgi:ABC-type amino acid transport substrate-binding protein
MLNLKVEWTEEVGFGQMIEGLSARRYDIVGSGIWQNAARSEQADFSLPLL